jgi:phosphosulfolactate synthase
MYDNYELKNIPSRPIKPRQTGFTMVMDKGLSLRDTESFIETSGDFVDIVKLGWATSYVYPKLKEKLDIYKSAGIPVYFGGTLFEAFYIRGQYEDYKRLLDKYQMTHAEVSDGSIDFNHDDKCNVIAEMAKIVTVLSEVGSKDANQIIPPSKWVELMNKELSAGSWKVIGEAREGGNVGLFQSNGDVRSGLVQDIMSHVPEDKIIWEAPIKSQQVFFIKQCGANVNLGNIAPSEVIPLETVRLGLRSDTFHEYLPKL